MQRLGWRYEFSECFLVSRDFYLHAICTMPLPYVTPLLLNVAALVVVLRSNFFTVGGRVVSTADCESLYNVEAMWTVWLWKKKKRLDQQKAV